MKSTRFTALLIVLAMLLAAVIGCDNSSKPPKGDGGSAAATTTPEITVAIPNNNNDNNGEYVPLKYGDKRLSPIRVSVHDPSIVYDNESGRYYLFGSHKAWAMSGNLAGWTTFNMASLETHNDEVFAHNIEWSKHGGANYSVEGNMWAPDVIYNKDMGKWCMYMSINGDNYYSSIVLLTSDRINGNYEYVGTIVYSGFTNAKQLEETNFEEVTGDKDIARYVVNGNWNAQYGPNAIDPCVLYDKNGDLWMSYGSWFGGIFMLKLDKNTGLRDMSFTYTTQTNVSDEYLGYRICGGYGGTGEGSYIVWDKDTGYYYLYMSYCGLDATDGFSGYHIRLFRSRNIIGPYEDSMGHAAVLTAAGQSQSQRGVKLFGNYSFSSLNGNGENSANGYKSGGHNSAFIDTDGQHYLIYHTRFNNNTEWHEVRVHQQFMNEDGWPVTAVYEHQGSVINKDGYTMDDIVGEYEFVDHGIDATTPGGNTPVGMLTTQKVTLNADGTITGDVEGTWDQHEGEDGNKYYVTMKIGSATYKGVFFKQYDESAKHTERMTFTLIGNNDHSIWGSKLG